VAGFGLAAACGMITGGRLGDIFGRRKMFAVGLGLFTLASAACGFAQSPGELIAGRVLQGLATALLTPQVLAIVTTAYAGANRAKAFVMFGLTVGFAGVFGQLIGGGLITANVAGLVAIVLPLVEGRQEGWPLWTQLSFVAAALLLTVFVLYQNRLARRGRVPLINLSLFRQRAFSVGLVTVLAWCSAMASSFLVLALYLQDGRSLSALNSGLMFLALGVGFFGASTLAPRLGARMGRQLLSAGSLVVAVGYAALAETVTRIGTSGSAEWLVLGLLVTGWGMVFGALPATVLATVRPESAAAASGVLTTVQEVGNALGVALVGIVFFSSLGHHIAPSSYPHAFSESLLFLAGFAVLVAILVQMLPRAPHLGTERMQHD
jgi:MFS family permease